jgi:SET domain-containing protein
VKSLEEANVNVSFKDNSNVVVVTATKDIKKGDEIKASYA